MPSKTVELFERHRALLFGVAYRMVGSVAEAEDVVQEVWLRWDQADRSQVADTRAYLIGVTSRTAMDHLRRLRGRRETYIGSWLPEPWLTAPDVAEETVMAESVSMAMQVVLETLSPLERAVFVLREAFGLSHAEIARALGRTEPAVRQVAHRAREHVRARQPRFRSDRAARQAATERFLRAALGGDLPALLEVLSPDVTLVADGGGKTPAPRRPLVGADLVARFLAGRARRIPADTRVRFVDINGQPGAVTESGGVPYLVVVADLDPDSQQISSVLLVANPDKLAHL